MSKQRRPVTRKAPTREAYIDLNYEKVANNSRMEIDDSSFIQASAIPEELGIPKKPFFIKMFNHCFLHWDSQYSEYMHFINTLDEFVKQTITVSRSTQKYKMVMGLRDVTVSDEVGEYQFLGGAKYTLQSQAPTKTLHYNVHCNLYMKIFKQQGSLVDQTQLLDETLAPIAFEVPKLYSSMEDNGFGTHNNTLLGINLDTSNYFPLGGLKYKIGYEENMPKNLFQIREPKEGEFVGDIISGKPRSTMSTYMTILFKVEDYQVEISLNIPKIKQSITISLKSLFMIFGYYTPKSAAKYLVLENDEHMFGPIIDRFAKMWSAPCSTNIEQTRKANNINELYNSIKQQMVGKDKIASYNKLESNTFCQIMLDGILPHVNTGEFLDSDLKVIYLCRYISSMIRCSFGTCYTTDRYSYKGTVLRSTTAQVKKTLQSAIDEYVRTIITQVWAPDFFSSIIDNNDKPIAEKVKSLRTHMAKPIERPKQTISANIIRHQNWCFGFSTTNQSCHDW